MGEGGLGMYIFWRQTEKGRRGSDGEGQRWVCVWHRGWEALGVVAKFGQLVGGGVVAFSPHHGTDRG